MYNHSASDFDLQFDCFHDTEKIEIHGNLAIVGYLSQDFEAQNPRIEGCSFGNLICFDRNYTLSDPGLIFDRDYFEFDLARKCSDKADRLIEYWNDEDNPFLRLIRHNQNLNEDEAEEIAEQAAQENTAAAVDEALEECVLIPYDLLRGPYLIIRPGQPGSIEELCDGYIYATPQMIINEYGQNTRTTREKALKLLRTELEVFNLYLSNDVYGAVVEIFEKNTDPDLCPEDEPYGWDQIDNDALWSIFGMQYAEQELDHIFESAKSDALKHYATEKLEAAA